MHDSHNIQREEHLAIENIFGKPPGWIVNWGITSGFLFLLVCLGITYFVKYPDKLIMKASIFSENPPIEVVSKKTGEIMNVLSKNNTEVEINQVILELKSTLSQEDIKILEVFIKEYESVKKIQTT